MNTQFPVLTCSAQELIFLAGVLGADALIGVEDPFRGWFGEELKAAWEATKQDLARRRLLREESDGRITLDTGVAALISTAAFPSVSFILTTLSSEGEQEMYIYHVSPHHVVLQKQDSQEETYTLRLVEGPAEIQRHFQEILAAHPHETPAVRPGFTREEVILRGRDLASQGKEEQIGPLLSQGGLSAETAWMLAEDMASPLRDSAIISMKLRDDHQWAIESLGILEGKHGYWLLKPTALRGEKWLKIEPASDRQVRQTIATLITTQLPQS